LQRENSGFLEEEKKEDSNMNEQFFENNKCEIVALTSLTD